MEIFLIVLSILISFIPLILAVKEYSWNNNFNLGMLIFGKYLCFILILLAIGVTVFTVPLIGGCGVLIIIGYDILTIELIRFINGNFC